MKTPSFQALRRIGLQARLAFGRIAPGTLLAGLLCMAGAAGLLWLAPHLRAEEDAQRLALQRARQALLAAEETPPPAPMPLAEARLAAFHDTLGEKDYAEQQVKTLFAIAQKNGLSLAQAEYKWSFDKNGKIHAYQIRLPVRGPYAAIRQFSEQTLLAIPFASLDEIGFKRDAVASDVLDAKLRLTLFLDDAAPTHGKGAAWE